MSVRVFLVALAALFATMLPVSAESLDDARAKLDRLMDAYVEKDSTSVLRQLQTDEFYQAETTPGWPGVVKQLESVYGLGGDIHGYELNQTRPLGERLAVLRYLVAFDVTPLLAEFMIYRATNEWTLMNFSFHFGTQATPTIKSWADQ